MVKRRENAVGFLFTVPFLVGFIIFFIAPFLVSVKYTFTFGTSGLNFVGFDNYIDVFHAEAFRLAAYNTLRFIALGVPGIMVVAMAFSLMLQSRFGGSSWFRSVFLFPMVVPIASTVMVFQIFFAYSGILNSLIQKLGLAGPDWINSEAAFYILIFLYIWKNCGYNIVLLLSGINSIPPDFYEVAQLEGANRWKQFRYITMPLMMPTFFFVFVVSIINSFKSFREAYLLSGTMPHSSIYMLQHFMNNNFSSLNYQRLSVAALLIFTVIFVCIFILFYLRKKSGDIQL